MALVTDPGAADANSYATIEELNTYATERTFVPDWFETATDPQKEAALKQAARLLDALFVWTGSPANAAVQALTWPREGMVNRNSYPIASTVIPRELKEAQCEFALALAAGSRTDDNDALKLGITAVQAGSVSVSFKEVDESSADAADVAIRKMEGDMQWASTTVPDSVRQLLVASWYTAATIKRPLLFEVV